MNRLIIVIIMLCLAFFLLKFRRQTKINHWFGGFIIAATLGQIAALIDPDPVRGVRDIIVFHEVVARFCSALSFWLSPYFLLLIGLETNRAIRPAKQQLLRKWLLFPVLSGFICDLVIDPRNGFLFVYLDFSKRFFIVSLWGIICTLLANAMLIYATITEKQPEEKLQKFLIVCLTLPTLLLVYHAYLLPLHGPNDFKDLVAWFGFFLSFLFIIFAVKYGIMGMKITIERDSFDSTMKVITSGTHLLGHVIKNKLQVIDLAAANLRSNKVTPERRAELLDIIENSSQQMRVIINSIRQKTADMVLDIQHNDLTALVTETLDCLKPLFEEQKIELFYQAEPVSIYCDKIQIQEVMVNLIRNAVEAMPKGGKLEFRLFRLSQAAVIKIQDHGEGIPAENMEKIYEPFFTTKKTEENFGLGLSYCYNVIFKHQGKLAINSEPGQGTTVEVVLPLADN